MYRVPNKNEINSINMYKAIIIKLQNYKNDIIGTDQNFDYINLDQHKNTQNLLDIFVANGLLPTITKTTRINKYTINIHASILTVDIADHLSVITNIGYSKQVHKITREAIKILSWV